MLKEQSLSQWKVIVAISAEEETRNHVGTSKKICFDEGKVRVRINDDFTHIIVFSHLGCKNRNKLILSDI